MVSRRPDSKDTVSNRNCNIPILLIFEIFCGNWFSRITNFETFRGNYDITGKSIWGRTKITQRPEGEGSTILSHIVPYVLRGRGILWNSYVTVDNWQLKEPYLMSLVPHESIKLKSIDGILCQYWPTFISCISTSSILWSSRHCKECKSIV